VDLTHGQELPFFLISPGPEGAHELGFAHNSPVHSAAHSAQGQGCRRKRKPHPLSFVSLGAARRRPLGLLLSLFVEHVRHRRGLPGLPEAMGDDHVSVLPQVVRAFRLVPEALSGSSLTEASDSIEKSCFEFGRSSEAGLGQQPSILRLRVDDTQFSRAEKHPKVPVVLKPRRRASCLPLRSSINSKSAFSSPHS
jgi:hypothetical protein